MSKLYFYVFYCLFGLHSVQAAIFLQKGMETYEAIESPELIQGELKSLGSTRLQPLMELWAEAFHRIYKDSHFDIKSAGSSTAPPALRNDEVSIAAMSREMTYDEQNSFQTEKGYLPLKLQVALDAVAIYVNRKNPINSITLPELDAIFSQNRACHWSEDIVEWSQVGWAYGKKIELFGHNKSSGAHKILLESVLCHGKFKENIPAFKLQDELLHKVSQNHYGIGYSSLNTSTSYNIKILSLSRFPYFPAYEPSPKNIASGAYPLTRYLYLYVNKIPGQDLPLFLFEFIKFVLSKQGQALVEQTGATPMTPHLIGLELLKLQ